MSETSSKRTAPPSSKDDQNRKKQKQRNFYRSNKDTIKPGDVGIFVTCNRKIERRCVGEIRDVFDEYVKRLYGDQSAEDDASANEEDGDIDAAIQAELSEKPKADKPPLIEHVNINKECLVFFRTRPPLNPVFLVHTICSDAAASTPDSQQRRTRFTKRLTPLSHIASATKDGLDSIAKKALVPEFHAEHATAKTFAIRPSIRDHTQVLNSDGVIKQVAELVGERHKVDLKNHEVLILVEVYKGICGISVVRDFEKLKRFNLSEIYEPTPKPDLVAAGGAKGRSEKAAK